MKFTNNKIYQLATDISTNLKDLTVYIPAKANFFLQKNIANLTAAATDIDKSRLEIAKHYGILDEETQQYSIPEENRETALKELEDLFNIEQEIEIKTFSIESLGTAEFTPAQMQAIMFMISEEE